MRVHISLPAKDMKKSQAFYDSLFGVPATKVKSDYLNYRLDEPSIHLSLIQNEAALPHPQQHFGIELPDAESFSSWEKRGTQVEDAQAIQAEPDAECCYARANKIWLTDPDGHRWELWHRTGEYDAMGSTKPEESSIAEPSTCC